MIRVISILFFGITLMFSVSCTKKPPATITINEKQAGTTVEVKQGDKVDIVLEGNPTTGFNWTVEQIDSNILAQVGESEFNQSKNSQELVGAGGTIIHHFEAVKPGQSLVKLIYHRSWEKDIPPIQSYEVTIVVN